MPQTTTDCHILPYTNASVYTGLNAQSYKWIEWGWGGWKSLQAPLLFISPAVLMNGHVTEIHIHLEDCQKINDGDGDIFLQRSMSVGTRVSP